MDRNRRGSDAVGGPGWLADAGYEPAVLLSKGVGRPRGRGIVTIPIARGLGAGARGRRLRSRRVQGAATRRRRELHALVNARSGTIEFAV